MLNFIGAFVYADDTVLICTSRKGQQEMLYIYI